MNLSWCRTELDWIPSVLSMVPMPWPREVALLWLRYVHTVTQAGGRAWCPRSSLRAAVPSRRELVHILGAEERDPTGRVLRQGWVADGRAAVSGGFGGARQLLEEGAWREAHIEGMVEKGELPGPQTSPKVPPTSPQTSPKVPPTSPQERAASPSKQEGPSPTVPPDFPQGSPNEPPPFPLTRDTAPARTGRDGDGDQNDPPPPTPPAGGAGACEPPGCRRLVEPLPDGLDAAAELQAPGVPAPASPGTSGAERGPLFLPPAWYPPPRRLGPEPRPDPQALVEAVLDCLELVEGQRPEVETCAVGAAAVLGAWRYDGHPALCVLRRRVSTVVTWADVLEQRQARDASYDPGALWYPVRGEARRAPVILLDRGRWQARQREAERGLVQLGWNWSGLNWVAPVQLAQPAAQETPPARRVSLWERVRGQFLGSRLRSQAEIPKLDGVLRQVIEQLGEDAEEAVVLAQAGAALARLEHEEAIAKQAEEAERKRKAQANRKALAEDLRAYRASRGAACG